ncbi:MAG: hypothetical protein HYT27_01065 [Parcubacteria group bacterium]|nr:hypothetical protein [Parcubacteria group bacterium]
MNRTFPHTAQLMRRHKIPLLIFFGAVALGVLFSFVAFAAVKIAETRSVAKTLDVARAGINADAEYALAQAKELDESRIFDDSIAARNIVRLVSYATDAARTRGLDGILIADKDGSVLTRTRAVSQRGDFIFHTTLWGRSLFERREVFGVEKGAAQPLIVFGAVPLVREDNLFGAIVTAYITDDGYAKRFRDAYFSRRTHAMFVPTEGAPGNSFLDMDAKKLLNAYFSPQSSFLESDGLFKNISLHGDVYRVHNAALLGADNIVGNLLIFKPNYILLKAFALSIIVTLLSAGGLGLWYLLIFRKSHEWKHDLFVIVLGGVVLLVSFSVLFALLKRDVIPIVPPPQTIYNSTLALEPEQAVLSPFYEYPVAIKVFSGGEPINTADVLLRYDPARVRVLEILTTNSFCRGGFFIERSIDNENGEVRVICGIPTPGFSEAEGIVAELLVQPKTDGPFSLRFDSEETKILANDGLGTNVLRTMTDGSYTSVYSFSENGLNMHAVTDEVLIFSPTHPNSERWYNNSGIEFVWQFTHEGRDISYKYLIDTNSDTIPDEGIMVDDTKLRASIERDGTYWFHLLAEGNGARATSHYKIKIDTSPPIAPDIRASATEVSAGDVVRFEFNAADTLSGLQRAFYISLDTLFFPSGRELFTAFPKKGTYPVSVRVFDNAGNYSESNAYISVK